ncbi:LacI family DNA-binding transcriptional regulator [Hufsiella ginkgonis]|uniref:Substrate-binding domain-containing protein n=1 Tax=Hufsiella ginkgonis TaxID=2695274 RepID=A0A7K1XU14_9SPHI|nr:LacI family DNA-binding transcriptional regulator [Hufsiella ginkgonis]MXV14474.1 substrate-binding domain-containing protein [Hufsiella ginkgonis]
MKFEPITIKDIAKALGLSTSTVSRALRDGYEISAETRRIVLEYAEKINYQPNPIALSLKERRSHSIGVIVCEIANNFFSQAINGIESIAYNSGYHVIITQSHESAGREVINLKHLASRSVDGLLVSLSSETNDISHFKELHDKGLPIVFFDRVTNDIYTHKVIANNFKGAFDATEYLINSGCRNIAHLTASAHLSITKERLDGYKEALRKYHIPFREEYVQYCNHGGMIQDEMERAVNSLIELENQPDSIFAANDKLTTGCLLALKKSDPAVASSIKITGFTNSNLTELFATSLTSVRQPAFEMGQIATSLLIELIESKRPVTDFQTRVLDTEMIIKNKVVAVS